MLNIFSIVFRSLKFYRRAVLFQIFTIILLTALITGALLIGSSVKESLKKSSSERLWNTGMFISSGNRYFSSGLAERLKDNSKIASTGILEFNGYCQTMNSLKEAQNIHIFSVNTEFFKFQGCDSITIKPGETFINRKLAKYLGINTGEELIIHLPEISDIPSDAPFSPSAGSDNSIVLKVSRILEPSECGNYSLAVNQVTPLNVFVNPQDLKNSQGKLNRLLIKKDLKINSDKITGILKNNLKPEDAGLRLRTIKKTNQAELYSDRIFIDESIIKQVSEIFPQSDLVLTYLGNRFAAGSKSTPYSFISALPRALYPEISEKNGMVINRWMANDLDVKKGDSIRMYWYSPDVSNKLKEKSGRFIISKIVDMTGIWGDSLLMPEFPGISGKESCTDWDAGVPVKMHEIRNKDEDYWKKYRGTPKAFISYEKGKELWGNNFGTATSVRFPSGISQKLIGKKLSGYLDPLKTGFTITDIASESEKAADQGVDFGTLFLSLGFFVILASLILLSFSIVSYFNVRKNHINTLYALGFTNRWVTKLLITETAFISISGCIAGSFAGYLIDIILIRALNTVWNGAVQTNTLSAYFNLMPVLSGFIISLITIFILMIEKVRQYLKRLHKKKKEIRSGSTIQNFIFLLLSSLITSSFFIISIMQNENKLLFTFASGVFLLITFVFLWRHYYLFISKRQASRVSAMSQLSRLYYSFNSSGAVSPVIFIATGIFIVFVIGINRMNFDEKKNAVSGGTGGYLLWCETAIPVKENLENRSSVRSLGLNDTITGSIGFVQMKRTSGNDASCLNLNHITAPPLLGINPAIFLNKKSFSFSVISQADKKSNPWQYLDLPAKNNTIYGIADQTVLEWGLKLKPGDTLIMKSESGAPLKIVLAAGLKSSVFQGNVLIGKDNFSRFYPSVSGSAVMLIEGKPGLEDAYKKELSERLENYGISIEKTADRLASFNEVSNTYLSVFAVFGAFGVIIGVIGLGFVLLKNYHMRKKEFALMLALGFHPGQIRRMIFREQVLILFAGVTTGIISALFATSASIKNSAEIPWSSMGVMIAAVILTGLITLRISVKSITGSSLISDLRKE